jgi:hypothetical protein
MKNLDSIIKKHLNSLKEEQTTENYMFFGNLKQMHRQCELLLQLDPSVVESILKDGHDWADDHVSVAKENIDQVFDFLMNTTNESMNESSSAQQAAIAINMKKKGIKPKNESYGEIDESKNCPTDPAKWAASKAKAKRKFDVYPSAYSNGFAAKDYKAKGGGWKKCK